MTTPTTPTSPNASVLIIGASKGLGQALAAQYLDLGSQVVATVRSEATSLHDLLATSAAGAGSRSSTLTSRFRMTSPVSNSTSPAATSTCSS